MLRLVKFVAKYFLSGAGYRARAHLLMVLFLKRKGFLRLARLFTNRLQKIQGIYISPTADFDSSLSLRHPVGVVVGDGVKIGKNVVIYQNVTLGGGRLGDAKNNNYPQIGDNTVIFAGAVVIGKVSVGKNCTIGANSVVLSDIPDGCTAVGAPAKVILKG